MKQLCSLWKTLWLLCGLALLLPAHSQAQTNRTPLLRAFLMDNMDANNMAITNIALPGVTNRQPYWLQGNL